eukprot:2517887-Pyramimonas_sp.AAC.1
MSIVCKAIAQDRVIEALETTFGQESTIHEPNYARRHYDVDEDGDYYEEKFYTIDADEDVDYEQEYWAEDDDTWYDCDESYYQRDAATVQ